MRCLYNCVERSAGEVVDLSAALRNYTITRPIRCCQDDTTRHYMPHFAGCSTRARNQKTHTRALRSKKIFLSRRERGRCKSAPDGTAAGSVLCFQCRRWAAANRASNSRTAEREMHTMKNSKNWFNGVTTMQALKERYKELAKAYHPDLNPEAGDEAMQQINAQYDELVKRFSRVSSDGCTEATEQEARSAADLAQAYREVIAQIIHLQGISIELCGLWLWVSGDTYANREALKAAGLRFASKKKMWYWRPEEAACHKSRRGVTMNDIRRKYGCDRIKAGADSFRLALAQ